MTEPEFKLLSDLRVTELKVELEKRGLDKNGIKIILSDRLEKAIRADGHDPATFKFCVSEAASTPAKQKSVTPAPEKVESTEELVRAESPQLEGPLEVVTEEEKCEDAEAPAPVEKPPQEPMDSKAPAGEEEQLDDPLDDKTESAKAAVAATADKNVDDIPRSFWVRGLTPAIKAADLRELFSAYGKVARAKIFTSKKEPGKTFGLLTMAEPSLVEACVAAMHGKQWNGMSITVERGNQTNLTAAKTTAAAKTAVKKPEPIVAPAKVEDKGTRKPDTKKDDTAKNGRDIAPPSSPSPVKDKEKNPRERIRRPADRIAPSSARIRREPIRSARPDSRKTISAARTVSSRSGGISSRTSGFRAPGGPLATRISRPGHPTSSRRPESYSSRTESGEVERIREEMRRRENDRHLERERERLRVERERIEREKLELQVMQQRQQLAALKASMEGSRSSHGDSRHDHSSRSSSSRDKYASRPSRPEPHRDSSRDKMSGRARVSRSDDRRPQMSSSVDRSRSRHDSRSHHDSHVRHDGHVRSDIRHDSHIRSEPRHESHMRTDSRYDSRGETRHDSSRHGGSSGRHSFPTRDAPSSSSMSGQHNYYGSRESYATGLSSREFDPSRAGTGSSWGQANWAGLPTDGWGVRSGGNGDWSSSGNYHSGSGASNIRIDYDKYRRQY